MEETLPHTDLIYKNHYIWVKPNPDGAGFIPYWQEVEENLGCRSRTIEPFLSEEPALRAAKARINSSIKARQKLQQTTAKRTARTIKEGLFTKNQRNRKTFNYNHLKTL